MTTGQERTKEQLYRQAKRLGIKGRSKMNRGQLKAALTRRGHLSETPYLFVTTPAERGRCHGD